MGIHTVGETVMRPTVMPGAASRAVQRTLEGPCGGARLLAVFPSAVYLAAADGTVLALVTSDAVRLPNAVVLTTERSGSPLTCFVREGDSAVCGAGALRVGTLGVHIARWWTPRRPRPPRDRAALRAGTAGLAAAFRRAADQRPGLPVSGRAALACLARSTADGNRAAAAAAAARLVGLGPGLTPSGDDVLSGFLLALRHLAGPAGPAGRAHEARTATPADEGDEADDAAWLGARIEVLAAHGTTDLSAALLGHAARGDGCAEAVELLDAVAGNRPLGPALTRLLTVGHTSGADLGLGVLAGARAVLDRRQSR
ncbi:DUF2877 domain-containing protein [Streptomyces inhibens]|uniref:DUF2877 domain-containing protein n=1 Tax=Streptomyces inhibens TaxID=2293571 RepID=UPI00402A8C39